MVIIGSLLLTFEVKIIDKAVRENTWLEPKIETSFNLSLYTTPTGTVDYYCYVGRTFFRTYRRFPDYESLDTVIATSYDTICA
jgi:hypothetical protein